MQGNTKIIELLNEILTNELTAINQYFIHSKLNQDWGYEVLASHMRAESIDEMKHADIIIDRILYLNGMPNLQRLGTVSVGESVPEQFKLDLELEVKAIKCLNQGIDACREAGDNGTLDLVKNILVSEEAHVDWLEAQLHLVEAVGLPNYLTKQITA